ncbi:hypothetical protein OPT61_g8581 [Boeremia exigua]|uniref:Uncharacterized protein n=1 Tax=Boeremia exigua TaxID=749465 RepID=A0ACC2HYU4_9PLEO|nr:hypothetical protein OPT61_g8581 [Boeremia exigua]
MTRSRGERLDNSRAVDASPLFFRTRGVSKGRSPREGVNIQTRRTRLEEAASHLNEVVAFMRGNEEPETPSERSFSGRLQKRPRTRSYVQTPTSSAGSSSRLSDTPDTDSGSTSTNTMVEYIVRGRSGDQVEIRIPMQSLNKQHVRSPSSEESDSGFFSEPLHESPQTTRTNNSSQVNRTNNGPQASRTNNGPSVRDLYENLNYNPEVEYNKGLTVVEKIKRDVNLSRDPRLLPGEKATRTNVGENSDLEKTLLDMIATQLCTNRRWVWTYYYLLQHKIYDEAVCITSFMLREFEGEEPAYRGDDKGYACENCIQNRLLCVRLVVDEKQVKRLSIASLPRGFKRRFGSSDEKVRSYYIRRSDARE